MELLVVGYDDSEAARAAMRWAAHYARERDAVLHVIYVVSSIGEWELAALQVNPDPLRDEFQRCLREEWTEPLREAGVTYTTHVAIGRPAEELMRYARRENAALIVIGMTGRGTLAELVAGGTAHDLEHHALRPVVAVPAHWNPSPADIEPNAKPSGEP